MPRSHLFLVGKEEKEVTNKIVMGMLHMGVSKTRDTPKWMVYDGNPLLKWMILGVPLFSETPI